VTNCHGTFLDVHGEVLDGPAKVHFMVPGTCGSFEDYVIIIIIKQENDYSDVRQL